MSSPELLCVRLRQRIVCGQSLVVINGIIVILDFSLSYTYSYIYIDFYYLFIIIKYINIYKYNTYNII